MAARSTTDQVEYLLSRRVAEARSRGAMSPNTEAIALFESIALNLLLRPRSVLYFAMLAKNGLRKVAQDELNSIAAMRAAILDLGNSVLSVRSTANLESARVALLQMEQLDRLSTTSNQYKKFDSSVTQFLTKTIGKSVRRIGATSLTRPGSEAASDLVSEFGTLNDLHTDMLDKFYALLVGVENFVNSPLATIVGLTTAARARSDIEDLISSIEEAGALDASRDMAIRLIASRSAIKSIGNLPSVSDPVIHTLNSLPFGYSISGVTDDSAASVVSSAGPFALPILAQVTVDVNGTSLGPFNIPQTGTDLSNKAAIVSGPVTYPINIPANYHLMLLVDGISYKLGPYAAGSTSMASLLAQTTGFISGSPLAGFASVMEFIQPGTTRLIIFHNTALEIRISDTHIGQDTDLIGGAEATSYAVGVYVKSIHSMVGFDGTEIGKAGTTPVQFVVDAFDEQFGSQVDILRKDGGTFSITTIATIPGTSMTITAPAVLGIAGTVSATSDSVKLYGTVNGVVTNPISPIGLVDVGDELVTAVGGGTISGLLLDRIKLAAPTQTFEGSIVVNSALTKAYESLISLLNAFYDSWINEDFASGLGKIDLAVASLDNGSPQAQRSAVLDVIGRLETYLVDLLARLDDPSAQLPISSAQGERAVVGGITSTLEERKFDRAVALFMKCRIQEALDSNADTASFGGSLLKAASDFARTDLIVQNRALDEGVETTATPQSGKGL